MSPAAALALVGSVALLLRVLVAWWIPTQPVSDFWSYISLAEQLLNDHRYAWKNGTATAYLAPGYPALLAVVFSVAGPSLAAVKVVDVLLSTAAVVFGGLAAGAMLGPSAGVAAAVLLALDPRQLLLACLAASEHLGAPALFAFLWLLGLSWRRERSLPLAAFAGLVLGISALARPVGLLSWLLWPSCAALAGKRRNSIALETLVLLAMVYGLLVPWGLRNQATLGRFTVSTTTAGINLFMGNSDAANGSFIDWRPPLAALRPETRDADEGLVDRIAAEEARRWIRAHPLRAASLYVQKLRMYFSWWSYSTVADWAIYLTDVSPPAPPIAVLPGPHFLKERRDTVEGVVAASLALLVGLALVGSWRVVALARRRRGLARPAAFALLGLVFYYPAVTAVFIVVDRYRWPLEDVLSLLAGLGAVVVVSWLARGRDDTNGVTPLLACDDDSTAPRVAG